MIRPYFSRQIVFVLGLFVALGLTSRTLQAAPQSQSDQSQGQSQEKPKKKGGFFDSVKQDSNSSQNSQTNASSNSGSSQGSGTSQSQGTNPGSSSSQKQSSGKGGFFQGMKPATGSSSQQASATASMGTKGVGEGAEMGNVTPTDADRQAVKQMEGYSVAQGDLSKFIEAGQLKPKQ